jgi:glucokinase
VHVVIENDVRAAAWGEFMYGAAAGADSLIAVFVGTGVGSGAVLDGRLWHGAGNAAGEVGHTQVVPDGVACPCGARGCLERYVSGSGFQQRLREGLAARVTTTLEGRTNGDPQRLTAQFVYEAAEAGDPFARNPRVLILGGGVIESVPALYESAARGVLASTTVLARALLIERASLGDWSGVVGAAALAR